VRRQFTRGVQCRRDLVPPVRCLSAARPSSDASGWLLDRGASLHAGAQIAGMPNARLSLGRPYVRLAAAAR